MIEMTAVEILGDMYVYVYLYIKHLYIVQGTSTRSTYVYRTYIDGLMQERYNSIANALELRLSCINQSIWFVWLHLLNFHVT